MAEENIADVDWYREMLGVVSGRSKGKPRYEILGLGEGKEGRRTLVTIPMQRLQSTTVRFLASSASSSSWSNCSRRYGASSTSERGDRTIRPDSCSESQPEDELCEWAERRRTRSAHLSRGSSSEAEWRQPS